jgi:hypothetical protein
MKGLLATPTGALNEMNNEIYSMLVIAELTGRLDESERQRVLRWCNDRWADRPAGRGENR